MTTVIETDRLRLREWRQRETDIHALHAILSDAETMKLWPNLFSRDDCTAWIDAARACYHKHGYGRWAVEKAETGDVIGDCGLKPTAIGDWRYIDLGWIIHADHHHNGYATEVARAIVDHAFGALDIKELIAHMADDHTASRRVAERLGMTLLKKEPYERDRNKMHLFFRLTLAE